MNNTQFWFWLAMLCWGLLLSIQARNLHLVLGVAAWLTIALTAAISGPDLCSPTPAGDKPRLMPRPLVASVMQISGTNKVVCYPLDSSH